jgi:protein farnesyltransferase/geranylgeranyltransferase type-1 subunit alpha
LPLHSVSRFTTGNPFACAAPLAKTLVPSASEIEADPAVDAGGKTPSLALEWLLDDAETSFSAATQAEQKQEAIKQAEHYGKRLCIADPIRSRYWQYRLTTLKKSADLAL